MLRVYWYDAPPASQRIQNPLDDGGSIDLRATTRFSEAQELHDALELAPNFALRMGEVVFRGWQVRRGRIDTLGKAGRPIQADDLVPQLEQKGVDLRIGLDIARLALRGLVDTLVVVTGDSDLIPAFKFARREGVRVLLEPLGAPVRRELKAHADAVLASA
ncbi:MAG: NYN domain-containing protein [Planctomycetes bacterium]|nr:NYN domain-containing protein [Planctomycetota bacterium]